MALEKCPRCIKGQVDRDWDGRCCIQCGFRPDDISPEAVLQLQRRQQGLREPRPPKKK